MSFVKIKEIIERVKRKRRMDSFCFSFDSKYISKGEVRKEFEEFADKLEEKYKSRIKSGLIMNKMKVGNKSYRESCMNCENNISQNGVVSISSTHYEIEVKIPCEQYENCSDILSVKGGEKEQ